MKTELQVPSDLRFLNIVENWLLGSLEVQFGQDADWPQHSNRFRLVLVEAFSNVVRHAHQGHPQVPVLLRLTTQGQQVRLEVWDCGVGFDLSTYLPPSPSDRQEGGYGWLILNRLMDKVEYSLHHASGRNCLKLEATLLTRQPSDEKESDRPPPDITQNQSSNV